LTTNAEVLAGRRKGDLEGAAREIGILAEAEVWAKRRTDSGRIQQLRSVAVPALAVGLRSSDVHVRRTSARSLFYLGDIAEGALEQLTKALGDPDTEVRRQSASALIPLKARAATAVPALGTLLEDSDPEVKKTAAKALGSIGSAAEGVIVHGLGSADPIAREACAFALAALGSPALERQIDRLTQLVEDAVPNVRMAASQVVARMARGSAVTAVLALRRSLKHENQGVRLWSAFALEKIAGAAESALDDLRRVLMSDPSVDVRLQAVTAVASVGVARHPVVAEVLEKALTDEDARIRTLACSQLVLLGRDATAALGKLSVLSESDPSESVRQTAAETVRQIRSAR
jgi:HEAT repeat protein